MVKKGKTPLDLFYGLNYIYAMVTFENHVLRMGSTRIHYQSAGSGEPLLLLHGLSGSSRWWERNMGVLAQRFHVYVIDLIGYGRSRGQRFVLHEAANGIQRMLDALELQRVHLMGHSMGGFISTELACQHPERVDRLVLVDALAVPIGRSVVRSAFGLVEALRHLPPDFLPVLMTDALRAGPYTLARTIYDIHRVNLLCNLGQLHARTMIVWGQFDTLLPLERGEQLRRALPLAEYVVIPGAGHNPMWDRPELFNQAVLAFLGKD